MEKENLEDKSKEELIAEILWLNARIENFKRECKALKNSEMKSYFAMENFKEKLTEFIMEK